MGYSSIRDLRIPNHSSVSLLYASHRYVLRHHGSSAIHQYVRPSLRSSCARCRHDYLYDWSYSQYVNFYGCSLPTCFRSCSGLHFSIQRVALQSLEKQAATQCCHFHRNYCSSFIVHPAALTGSLHELDFDLSGRLHCRVWNCRLWARLSYKENLQAKRLPSRPIRSYDGCRYIYLERLCICCALRPSVWQQLYKCRCKFIQLCHCYHGWCYSHRPRRVVAKVQPRMVSQYQKYRQHVRSRSSRRRISLNFSIIRNKCTAQTLGSQRIAVTKG